MRHIGWSLGAIALLVYLAANVVASQDFPRLFYALTTQHQFADAQQFLQYVEGTPLYKGQFAYYNRLYRNGFVKAAAAQKEQSLLTKEKYRGILTKNAKSRDALVVLALYELKAGNKKEAARLYAWAKNVDPWLSVGSLEKL